MKSRDDAIIEIESPMVGVAFTHETEIEPILGRGKCTICKCDAYNSDSQHDGHCICGHLAADHAF